MLGLARGAAWRFGRPRGWGLAGSPHPRAPASLSGESMGSGGAPREASGSVAASLVDLEQQQTPQRKPLVRCLSKETRNNFR